MNKKEITIKNVSKICLKFISKVLLFLMLFNFLGPLSFATEVKKVNSKPLVILMEYADYKFSDIDINEEKKDRIRGGKGKDFTKEYVREWLFSKDNYISPDIDGKNHEVISIRKALSQVSGGTYDFNGEVVGPYTSKHNGEYYGKNGQESTRYLIDEAIEAAAADPDVDFLKFDVETRIRNVDTNETHITYGKSDGQVDTIIVIHPGIGGEWGGGSLGENAVWPYRRGYTWHGGDWNLKEYEVVDHKGDTWRFDDFLIVAQDSASDIVMHEFGHILGLPDLYATGNGNPPVQYWDIMGGSYTGKNIPGDGPISYGAYNRFYLQKSFEKGNADFVKWANIVEYDLEEINGQEINLNKSSERLENTIDLAKINLPEKEIKIVDNKEGKSMFFTGKGNDLKNSMIIKDIDLTNYEEALLEFDAWYKLDPYFDFATIRVKESSDKKEVKDWKTLKGNITTDKFDDWLMENETEEERKERNPGHGITAYSEEWLKAEFNLSEYVGKKIDIAFYIHTDSNTPEEGMYFDNISITGINKDEIDNKKGLDILNLKADNYTQDKLQQEFIIEGFEINTGKEKSNHYYLLEWRKGELGGIDGGHENLHVWNELSYEPGMLIWYINEYYIDDWGKPDQNTGEHPGYLFAGVIDSDQNPIEYKDSEDKYNIDGRVDYNMHDATFNLKPEKNFNYDWGTVITEDRHKFMFPNFEDSRDYSNSRANPQGGVILDNLGLKIMVLEQNSNNTSGKIKLINKNNSTKNLEENKKELSDIDVRIIENNLLELDVNKYGDKVGLGSKAYISYSNKSTKREVATELILEDGIYTTSLDFLKNIKSGNYEINFIILEDKDGNSKAIYNSNVHSGYGLDLSKFDLNTEDLEEVKVNKDKNFAYLDGYKDNTIRPKDFLTREEAVDIIFRILDDDFRNTINKITPNYLDIEKDRWSVEQIGSLFNAGIIEGNEDSKFRPLDNITRGEVVTMLARLVSDNPRGKSNFNDINKHWAKDYIEYAYVKEWIKGYKDGSFKPNEEITRAEFVTIINNLLGRDKDFANKLEGKKEFKDLDNSKWYYMEIQKAVNSK